MSFWLAFGAAFFASSSGISFAVQNLQRKWRPLSAGPAQTIRPVVLCKYSILARRPQWAREQFDDAQSSHEDGAARADPPRRMRPS